MEHSCIQWNLGSSLIAKLLGPHWFMFLFSANPDSCVQQIRSESSLCTTCSAENNRKNTVRNFIVHAEAHRS